LVIAHIYQLPTPFLLALALAPCDDLIQLALGFGYLLGMPETLRVPHMVAVFF